MIPVKAGDKVPLFVTVDTNETDLNVTAKVVNRATLETIANGVTLVWNSGMQGYVNNSTVEFPDDDDVLAIDATYFIKNSANDTLLKTAGEVFVNADILGGEGGGGGTVILGQPVAGIVKDLSVVIGIITEC